MNLLKHRQNRGNKIKGEAGYAFPLPGLGGPATYLKMRILN